LSERHVAGGRPLSAAELYVHHAPAVFLRPSDIVQSRHRAYPPNGGAENEPRGDAVAILGSRWSDLRRSVNSTLFVRLRRRTPGLRTRARRPADGV